MTPGDARALVGQQLGAYQLEALLPIGGLPECFKARHIEVGREVAVKFLPGSLVGGRETLTALREETRRISALKHPNILPIYGIAETQSILYAVMPPPIESLRDQLDREGTLPATRSVQLAAQLAWALHALHGIGFVHGDVQPGTLIFGADGTLQLADFGVARALVRQRGRRSRVASRTWPMAGVRSYVAPEAALTGEISVQADIYALGAVLYEMLIGALPRQQAMLGEPELLTAPLPPSMRSSETWPELAAVALKALERDPAKRYSDARAFAIALRRAVIVESDSPRGPSLRDALAGVWHPEADEAAGAAEAEAFKRRLTMPPAPTLSQKIEPTLKEKLATAPPLSPSVPSRPAAQPPARKATMPPAASLVPPRTEDDFGTTLLPDRSIPKPERAHEDDAPTTVLPGRALQQPPRPPAAQPPVYDVSTMPLTPPGVQQQDHPPLRLPLEPPPATPMPHASALPAQADSPVPPDIGDGYVSPAELAQTLAGRRPGPARRLIAALAGLLLLLAFGVGTAVILTGFDRALPGGPPTTPPSATATAGATATSTIVHATATTLAPLHSHAAVAPTATIQPTLPPLPPTATPRPTATPTPTPTPPPTATPSLTPSPTP